MVNLLAREYKKGVKNSLFRKCTTKGLRNPAEGLLKDSFYGISLLRVFYSSLFIVFTFNIDRKKIKSVITPNTKNISCFFNTLYVHIDNAPKIATPNSKTAFLLCHLLRF